MSDINYKSYDGIQENVSMQFLDPIGAGWLPGSWQDTAKFNRRFGLIFDHFTIISGGTEDALDVSCRNMSNLFIDFEVSAGDKYVLTLKGSSSYNGFTRFLIIKPGKWVDVQIGNWHDDDPLSIEQFGGWASSEDNVFSEWRRADGKPIRYAYRFGCKPKWVGTDAKHLWWMSLGLSAYWLAKYALWKLNPKT
jgi:hypothetical protein